MFLKKMYVNGFKSFADKTEIIVEKGITAIVGPNGSGKSNISDAIKWVLGEQSAKSLRGGKMEDVIFAGTEKRMPLGFAEVNLVFDNENGMLPVEYKEVSIRRKLYKTGESEYYINKQQCRLKDIKELFMDTGIGRDGYSVIGQGRVEDILSPNSDVRRAVFEEAAGIVKYKARKDEAIKKLEKTNDNLERVQDIIHELEQRIEPLKDQSEKAKRYIELKNDLKKYELNYFVREYEKQKEQLTLLENQKEQSTKEKEDLIKERDMLALTIENCKERLSVLEEESASLEAAKAVKNKEHENAVSLCNVQNEKRLLYQANISNVQAEITGIDERNDKLLKNIDYIVSEKDYLYERLKNCTEKFDSMSAEIKEYKDSMDSMERDMDDKKNELFELHKEINKLLSSKNTYESFVKNDDERIEQIDAEIRAEQADSESKSDIIDMLVAEKKEIKESIMSRKAEYEGLVQKYSNCEAERLDIESSMRLVSDELGKAKSKLSVLKNMETYYDGYYKSIQVLMKSRDKNEMLKRSILGTVADVIKTDKQYETAIEIALGAAIQNVIVNSEHEAEQIIEYLKVNKIGRVTFLPIEMIQERSLNSHERQAMSDSGVIDTADKLIEVAKPYDKVLRHLLARTIVVKDIKDGFRVSKKLNSSVKIVSLQGDVINPGGSVTGGHLNANQNLLGRKREIDECELSVGENTGKLNLLNEKTESIKASLAEIAEGMEAIKNEVNEKNSLINTADAKIKMLEEQKIKNDATVARYQAEKQYMQEERSKHSGEVVNVESSINVKRQEVEDKERAINEAVTQNAEFKKQYEEFNDILAKQREEVTSLNHEIKLKDERISGINTEIDRNNTLRASKAENLNDIEDEIKKATELIGQYTNAGNILANELKIISEKYSASKSEMSALQSKIYDGQNQVNEGNKKITEILDEENGMNVKIERGKSRIEDISSKMWDEYEMNYAMALKYKDESVSYTRMYNDVNSYKKAIRDLGDINVSAIEEYKEVNERYNFLAAQKKDLTDAKSQLNDVIRELEIKMKERFLEEFANIRVKFNEVFTKLFNGGKADVYLEDETDALNSSIEIAIQPPGKKLSKISLLSGGEKSLTAIALLFAILKTKPTPFCILDEIEAALDDVNIFRFTQYLREFSKETQFLVITHRKGSMEAADTLYGTTMEEKGVTKLVSMRLSEIDAE